jgi:hypothetical protein
MCCSSNQKWGNEERRIWLFKREGIKKEKWVSISLYF